MARTITVRGFKIRSASRRRFIVVGVRPSATTFEFRGVTDVVAPGAWIIRRSDNIATAREERRRFGVGRGTFAVVVDTVTGEEVV